MKLSKQTRAILSNYVSINDSIFLEPGKILKSKAANNSIISESKIEEDFPVRFPIGRLTEFLSALSLFKDPDLAFEEGRVVISENNIKVPYIASSSKLVKQEDFNSQELPVTFSFNIDDNSFKQVMKAANSMGHDWIIVKLDSNNRVVLQSVSSRAHENSRNDFFTTLEEPTLNELESIEAIFQVDQLTILDGNYKISFDSTKKFAELENTTTETKYWLGLHNKSTFK